MKGTVIMSPQDMKETLLARTIEVIANEGLDKTTTKAITAGTGINEAYIYRHFSDKEDLLAKAFDRLDEELVTKTMQHVDIMYVQEMEYEMRCRFFFGAVWKFMLGNRNKCLAFVRYYYSPYFKRYSYEAHKRRYAPLVEKFCDAFRDEADVWMILNHILNVMLDFAVKVHNDQMPNEDDYSEHVFRVIYASIRQYFKRTEESDS
ncbi:MAG: TetR/AcrR family transcriptional regulator [Bacteroidaceae bacterium]|nr:TetR/AcrR family transcriptional regulator [Bacteroidaceae bacterium]